MLKKIKLYFMRKFMTDEELRMWCIEHAPKTNYTSFLIRDAQQLFEYIKSGIDREY